MDRGDLLIVQLGQKSDENLQTKRCCLIPNFIALFGSVFESTRYNSKDVFFLTHECFKREDLSKSLDESYLIITVLFRTFFFHQTLSQTT